MTQTLRVNNKRWLVRILFALTLVLLCGFFVLGMGTHYKIILMNNIGANPKVNSSGEFQLSPIPEIPAAEYG